MRHVGRRALQVAVLDRARDNLRLRGALLLAEERLRDQVDHVPELHVPGEAAEQLEGLDRVPDELVEDQLPQLLVPDPVDLLAREAGRIDRRALEVLVPVLRVVHEAPLDVLVPERRAAVDAHAVEAEAVDADLRGELERRPQILLGLVRDADDEESVDDLDARVLRVRDRGLDLRERLLLLEPVEDLLAAALDAEHDRAASRLRELREEVLSDGVDAALQAVLDLVLLGDQAVAHRLDALGLQQEMVVDEVDGAVALVAEVLELVDHVLRAARPP